METLCAYTLAAATPRAIQACAPPPKTGFIGKKQAACKTHLVREAETNHDSSIYRIANGTYYLLSGGCTFNGTNDPSKGECEGNAQVWTSHDLFAWKYLNPLTSGGPGQYWELPYLLPFDAKGNALRNDEVESSDDVALLFGMGNAYFLGRTMPLLALLLPRLPCAILTLANTTTHSIPMQRMNMAIKHAASCLDGFWETRPLQFVKIMCLIGKAHTLFPEYSSCKMVT